MTCAPETRTARTGPPIRPRPAACAAPRFADLHPAAPRFADLHPAAPRFADLHPAAPRQPSGIQTLSLREYYSL